MDYTSVQSLPTAGLEKLRRIHARNCPYLLRFPKLPELHEALLTYPYHCCALKEYGFGVLYDNKQRIEPTLYRCDTGEKVKQFEKKYHSEEVDKYLVDEMKTENSMPYFYETSKYQKR